MKNLERIEEMLVKEIEWYMSDDVSLKDKQAKLNVSLGTNRMINSVIMIETLSQRSKAIENNEAETKRKIDRFKK